MCGRHLSVKAVVVTAGLLFGALVGNAAAESPSPYVGWSEQDHEDVAFSFIECAGVSLAAKRRVYNTLGALSGEEKQRGLESIEGFRRLQVGLTQIALAHFQWAGYEEGYPGFKTNGEISEVVDKVYLEFRDLSNVEFLKAMDRCSPHLDEARKLCESIGTDDCYDD